jgi:hypothetical protein
MQARACLDGWEVCPGPESLCAEPCWLPAERPSERAAAAAAPAAELPGLSRGIFGSGADLAREAVSDDCCSRMGGSGSAPSSGSDCVLSSWL